LPVLVIISKFDNTELLWNKEENAAAVKSNRVMVRDQKKVENLFLIETVEMHGMPQLRYDQSVTQSFHQISAINILRTRLIFWQRLF